jgi:hypothetical protein
MSVIDDIVSSASGSVPLADVLRRCLALAHELGNDTFRSWVDRELSGYPPGTELPAYRSRIPAIVRADVANAYQRWPAIPVLLDGVPPQMRASLEGVDLRDSVAALERIVRSAPAGGETKLAFDVPRHLWQFFGFTHGVRPIAIWRDIGVHEVAAVLDAVRNTALTFALDLGQQQRAGGLAQEQMTNIFNVAVSGGVVAVAGSAGQILQVGEVNVREGDLDSLLARLRQIGVADADLDELTTAIAGDAATQAEGPGSGVWSWLKRAGGKVGSAAGTAATAALEQAITAAMLHFYGMK